MLLRASSRLMLGAKISGNPTEGDLLVVGTGGVLDQTPASSLSSVTASAITAVPSGLLMGAGGSIAVASPGVDYLTPTGSGAGLTNLSASHISGVPGGILKGVSGALTTATEGTDFLVPNGDGSGLTNLTASNLGSGTVPTARLGSGTATTSTFLRGDGTWSVPSVSNGFPDEAPFTDPTIPVYTWFNQGPASVTVNSAQKTVLLSQPNNNTGVEWHALYRSVSGTTFTWVIRWTSFTLDFGFCWPAVGVRNSVNKNTVLCAVAYVSNIGGFYIQHLNEDTPGATSSVGGPFRPGVFDWRWLKITGDGTSITFYLSQNGVNWLSVYSETIASYIGNITHIGYGVNGNGATTQRTAILISSDSLS